MNDPLLITARLGATLPGIPLFESGASLPKEIQWMPPGRNTITATQNAQTVTKEILVNPAAATRVNEQLQAMKTRAAQGEDDLPFFDFNHEDNEASAHPTEFYWAGDDPKTGGIRAKLEWTEPGENAIKGKAYRRFSPSFYVNAAGEVTGTPINMGGLVNRAAFKTIQAVWAKSAPAANQKEHTTTMADTISLPADLPGCHALITKLQQQMAESDHAAVLQAKDTEITNLKGKITLLEDAAKVNAKDQAKAAVASAVAAGKIEPKNADLIKQYEELHLANPVTAKAILDSLPVNAAFKTVVLEGGKDNGTRTATTSIHLDAKAVGFNSNGEPINAKGDVIPVPPSAASTWNKQFDSK